MKKTIFLTIIAFLILVNIAIADHRATIKFVPDSWEIEKEERVSLVVENSPTSAHNIVKIEVNVPVEENVTAYKLKDIFTLPSGWEASFSIKAGEIYKVTFSSITGISPGAKATFVLESVKSPSKIKEYVWQVITTDKEEKTFSTNITTKTLPGPLAYFAIETPKEAKAGKTYAIVITAYDAKNNTKTDYVGTITIRTTDKNATLPKNYTFRPEDKGVAKILVIFATAGNQTLTIRDEKAKIEKTSDIIKVILPTVPTNLSISINKGERKTNKIEVVLDLKAKDALECRFSNDNITWSTWEAYNETKAWNLTVGDGLKTVYYQCRNEVGESEIASDTIELITVVVPLPTLIAPYIAPAALIISLISLGLSVSQIRKKKKTEE